MKLILKHWKNMHILLEHFVKDSFDYTIKIWEINSWKGIQTLYGHEFNIICLISLKYQNENDNENNVLIASFSNCQMLNISSFRIRIFL